MARRHKTAKVAKPPESWIHRHPRTVLAVLVAISIVARLTYFFQLDGTPFARMHEWRQTDMHYYDGWATQIAGGDWMSASVRLPMHRWHHEVAAGYLAQHPEAAPALERRAQGAGVDRDEILWSQWMHAPQFYQDPLYAYLVAATYKLAPADARSVLAWQLTIGVFTNVLIWLLARRVFGDTVAAFAAGLAMLCAPLMFYEILLLRDSLIAFTGLALVWLLDRAVSRGGWWWSGGLGIALGAACLLKGTFVLLAAGVVLFLLIRAWRREPSNFVALAGTVAGLVIALTPSVARNVAVGVPPFALAASGPLTFVTANHVGARPDVGFGIDTNELTRFLGTTGGGWRPAIVEALGGHTVTSYASLLWRKWDRLWHWFEIPNNENFYYMRLKAPVLSWLPVTFRLLSPLALVGLVLGARRWREAWPLYLLAAVTAAPLVLFYVLGRFRVAFLAAVIPFAALTLVEWGRAIGARRYGRGLGIAAALVIAAAWTGRPLADDQLLIRTADWILPWSVTYESQVYGALDAKDPARAAAAYLDFFKYEPSDAQILESGDPQLAPELADMHNECAQILRLSGQSALADAQVQRAQRLLSLRTSQ